MPKINDDINAARKKFIRLYKEPKMIFLKMISSRIGPTRAGTMMNNGAARAISIISNVFSEPGSIPKRVSSSALTMICDANAMINPRIAQPMSANMFGLSRLLSTFMNGRIRIKITTNAAMKLKIVHPIKIVEFVSLLNVVKYLRTNATGILDNCMIM